LGLFGNKTDAHIVMLVAALNRQWGGPFDAESLVLRCVTRRHDSHLGFSATTANGEKRYYSPCGNSGQSGDHPAFWENHSDLSDDCDGWRVPYVERRDDINMTAAAFRDLLRMNRSMGD
jgi:hypothetical protein